MHRGCLASIVDHMADLAVIAQRHGNDVVEPHLRIFWRLNRAGQNHIRINEDAVSSQSPCFVTPHSVRYLVRGPAIHARCTRIACLVRRIVGNLGLIKISPPAVAIPQNLEFLVMFHKQAIDRDIVSIYH